MPPQLAEGYRQDVPQAVYDLDRALARLRKLPKTRRFFFLSLSTLTSAEWTQQTLLALYQDAMLKAAPASHHARVKAVPAPYLLQRIVKELTLYEHIFSIAYHKQLQALTDSRKMAVLSDLLGSTDVKVKLAALKLWMEFDGNIGRQSSMKSSDSATGTRVKVRELHIHPPTDSSVSPQYSPVQSSDSARAAKAVPVKTLTISRLQPQDAASS